MAVDNTPGAGSLYRLDPDGSVRIVLREITVSNGIGWSPDGGTAYYNVSATLTGTKMKWTTIGNPVCFDAKRRATPC